MTDGDALKLFHLTHSLVQADLRGVQDEHRIDLGINIDDSAATAAAADYYPQVAQSIRAEAAEMARHYELFYCLENFIRDLVSTRLVASEGAQWWESAVPQAVQDNVKKNMERERDAGMTRRSEDYIDYTTFGELGDIIQAKWDVFNDTFNNRRALTKILSGLNLLRGPIAHCSPLASDEVARLQLALKDFFRLME